MCRLTLLSILLMKSEHAVATLRFVGSQSTQSESEPSCVVHASRVLKSTSRWARRSKRAYLSFGLRESWGRGRLRSGTFSSLCGQITHVGDCRLRELFKHLFHTGSYRLYANTTSFITVALVIAVRAKVTPACSVLPEFGVELLDKVVTGACL